MEISALLGGDEPRSHRYRFPLLGQLALLRQLPASLAPAQVRCALTALIRRIAEGPGTFDSQGWLTIGLSGHQLSLGEHYVSTGSLYLTTVGLLPLRLSPHAEFWQAPPRDRTSRKVWSGHDLPADHALAEGPA